MNQTTLAAILALSFATPASADVVSFTFDGTFGSGSIDGRVVVDVQGGLATSGSATISGWGIDGVQTLGLVTPAGLTYRSANGTDIFGGDNRYPLDGGMVFGSNAPPSLTGGYNFGIWAEAGRTSGFASGPGLWSYTGELTVAAAPEASTWVMFAIGASMMAAVGYRKTSRYAI